MVPRKGTDLNYAGYHQKAIYPSPITMMGKNLSELKNGSFLRFILEVE